ncbi:uncharacterized protein [Diabrotica undecimpunctata]|uniref:uncharacterized protein n=1 Tax=Diabrotica undecimpunctata TaxID=50387 RepID=UPI003B64028B
MQFRPEGEIDTAIVMKDIVFFSPSRVTKYKEAYSNTKQNITSLTSDEALSIVVEGKLTKIQYNLIRNTAREHNSNMYPNYEAIISAKTKCYPDNLRITKSVAEASLQQLLDHTVSRLFRCIEEVTEHLKPEVLKNLYLITKWSCDGSFGISEYKQKFLDPNISDSNIFLTSIVPIQLISGNPKTTRLDYTTRLDKKLDLYQSREQAGFRANFGTNDHLQTIKQLIEKSIEYNKPLVVTFVDFHKAFDSVELDSIIEALNQALKMRQARYNYTLTATK